MAARRPIWAGVLAGLLLLVAGTAALWWRATHVDSPPTGSTTWPARPASLPTPAVVWPDGPPDDGTWADDEWVQALRAATVALAVGHNAHDYSDPILAELVSQRDIEVDANRQRGFADGRWRHGSTHEFLYLPGPRPMQIVGVVARGDEAFVGYCYLNDWAVPSASDVIVPDGSSTLHVTSVRLERRGDQIVYADDGPARFPTGVGGGRSKFAGSDCDPTQLHAGYFDPPPPYGEPFAPWDVIGPDGTPMSPPPTDAPAGGATPPTWPPMPTSHPLAGTGRDRTGADP